MCKPDISNLFYFGVSVILAMDVFTETITAIRGSQEYVTPDTKSCASIGKFYV